MIAVIQRVRQASVKVDSKTISQIGAGSLVLLGVMSEDSQQDADFLVEKIINLRIFQDELGKMNLSLGDVEGEVLVVSQFTLCADCLKGRRPGFSSAADPKKGRELYDYVCTAIRGRGFHVETGHFGAYMTVSLENDGPATFVLDSEKKFK